LDGIGFEVVRIKETIEKAFATIIIASNRIFKIEKNHRMSVPIDQSSRK
jgi:hypothetical protein